MRDPPLDACLCAPAGGCGDLPVSPTVHAPQPQQPRCRHAHISAECEWALLLLLDARSTGVDSRSIVWVTFYRSSLDSPAFEETSNGPVCWPVCQKPHQPNYFGSPRIFQPFERGEKKWPCVSRVPWVLRDGSESGIESMRLTWMTGGN